MKLKTRTVEIAGITCQPDENWMTQVARNLTDAGDGFLRGVQYLILDRDPLYTAAFRRPAAGQWREALAPACAESEFERVCRAICRIRQVRVLGPNRATRRERTSGPPSARSWITIMRNGRTKVWATSSSRPRQRRLGHGPVRCRERLGGVLKFYYREAA